MAEAVRCAGGWLFDRVMAGWDVTVLTPDHADPRPLRILGARAADLDCALASPVRGPRPKAIAVCAGLYGSDARVRRLVLSVLDEELVEVTLWDGEAVPDEAAGQATWQPHRLSVAARAFKAQAMAAAAVPGDAGSATEFFRLGEPAKA
ncbi:hypothetical protein E1293_01800 [Actinomadura darangshiensis]|uniref:Uncharacterized protein n=1 Tax=Actinomadura darangshiensis TaxID=705336 RepID=A0A4R5C4M5_9ACTN|nr:hypothetical protein [Actinomadura darangshiensis]TDD91802.1 hypothetical protein E1293_01800 [Actinomadura darangshiensis]